MSKIRVSNIQRLCVNDGPGVRTVVFLHGCTLQCPWCCNPETINDRLFFDKKTCTYPTKKIYCNSCEKYEGTRGIKSCPINAFEPTYTEYTVEELLSILLKDESIYENGGITFSGGEPLYQSQELLPLLEKLRKRHIHIAMETTLYVSDSVIEQALNYVDYWLVDVKFQFGYFPNRLVDINNVNIDNNLHQLLSHVDKNCIQFRMVLMHEAMKNIEKIVERMIETDIQSVEILGYHSMAKNKYEQLGLPFHPFTPPSDEDFAQLQELCNKKNINITKSTI